MPLSWTNTGSKTVSMFGIDVAPGQTIRIANNDPTDPTSENWQGAWVSDFDYVSQNEVGNDGDLYVCLLSHRSAEDNEPGTGENWTTYWARKIDTPASTAYLPDSSGKRYVNENQHDALAAATTLDGTHPPVVLGDAILSGGTNSNPLALRTGPLKPLADSTTAIQVQQADGTVIANVDTTNKRIGFGTLAPAAEHHVASILNTSPRGSMSSQHNDGTDGARFHGRKSRGTNAAPTVIVTGDNLMKLVASGYDGSAYQEMAAISFQSTGTIAAGRVPTKIVFSTATDASPSVLTDRFTIDQAGAVTIASGGSLKIGTQQVLSLGAGQLTGNLIVGDGGASLSHGSGTEGYYNTVVGVGAGASLSTASYSVAVGKSALASLGGNGFCTAVGASALNLCTGNNNNAFGQDSGASLTTGIQNCYFGGAGYYNRTGSYNTLLGNDAGKGVIGNSHSNNTFIGYQSGYSVTTGGNNFFGGYQAGYYNASGAGKTELGYQAGYSASSAANSVSLGYQANYSATTNGGLVSIGYMAGKYETASDKLFIDNRDRTNEAGGRANSLIYGLFDAAIANQFVQINGKFACNGVTPPAQTAKASDASGTDAAIINAIRGCLIDHGLMASA